MSLKKSIRHFLHIIKCKILYENPIAPALYCFLCRIHLIRPSMIIYVDGGICSQMHQYLLGRYYAEQGMRVQYDLGWYRRNGKDKNGIHSRIFEFDQLWPSLPLEIAPSKTVTFYSYHFCVKRNGVHFPLAVEPPKYFQGYYFFDDEKQYGDLFRKYFSLNNITPLAGGKVFDDWEGVRCAIHIRRGDLAGMDDTFYGKVSNDYFHSAVSYVSEQYPSVKFFVFSDEIDWVEENLSYLFQSYPHQYFRGNNAFEDLALMAQCDCFISSQGSAGKFAAMINGKGCLIISDDPHETVWTERYLNTIIFSN